MADQPWIVVAGESLIDRVVGPDGGVAEYPGGGPFNTARVLARLGCRVSFLGGLSTDPAGMRLRDALAGDGVDLSLAQTVARPTLVATATVDADGVASYTFAPPDSAAAALTQASLPDGVAALHVGTLGLVLEPTADTLARLAGTAPPEVLVMVDLNVRPLAITDAARYRARLDGVLGRTNAVKASADDLAWLARDVDPGAAAAQLVARLRDPGVVLLTAGPAPVRIVTPAGVRSRAVPPVPVVDTIGAGDAFGAGFLAAWLEAGRDPRDLADPDAVGSAVTFAIGLATETVTRPGGSPAAPAAAPPAAAPRA